MNKRQALKASAKEIERLEGEIAALENYKVRASADIKAYNTIITGLIAGTLKVCDWCEDREECQLAAKVDGVGCNEWWLAYDNPVTASGPDGGPDGEGGDEIDSKGILPASPVC